MILVVGSTGNLGSEICRQLVALGKPVRAMVRATSDPAKVAPLIALGAETVQADLRDRASLDAACQGVRTVISTATSISSYQPGHNDFNNVDVDGLMSLIHAAKGAGVYHMIFTSLSGHFEAECPFVRAKRAVEEHLKASGLTYTILRPTFFLEDWLSPGVGFDYANGAVTAFGSGRNPISWISFRDVAQFAVASVDNPAARNATLELGGPEALSPLDVVGIFERVGGKQVEVQHVPEEDLAAQQAAAQDPLEQSFPALMRCYARGDVIDMRKTLQAFPLQLGTVEEYARRVLGAA